jgi:hypothetical protein
LSSIKERFCWDRRNVGLFIWGAFSGSPAVDTILLKGRVSESASDYVAGHGARSALNTGVNITSNADELGRVLRMSEFACLMTGFYDLYPQILGLSLFGEMTIESAMTVEKVKGRHRLARRPFASIATALALQLLLCLAAFSMAIHRVRRHLFINPPIASLVSSRLDKIIIPSNYSAIERESGRFHYDAVKNVNTSIHSVWSRHEEPKASN